MSRTLTEIKTQLYVAKSAEGALSGLTSTSLTAVWKLILDIVAVGIFVHEQIFDIFLTDVKNAEAKAYAGTATWYRDKALEFQIGDTISDEPPFVYDPVDADNQIIKRAAAVDTGGTVSIKVAKLDGAGLPIPLSGVEFDAFKSYIGKIKFAGITAAMTTASADILNIIGNVYVDPAIIASDGSLVSDPSIFPVLDAVTAYSKNLPFDGVVWKSAVIDAIQSVPGVEYPGDIIVQAGPAAGSPATFLENYAPVSGYFVLSGSVAINYFPA
jgi:hypothetical protein